MSQFDSKAPKYNSMTNNPHWPRPTSQWAPFHTCEPHTPHPQPKLTHLLANGVARTGYIRQGALPNCHIRCFASSPRYYMLLSCCSYSQKDASPVGSLWLLQQGFWYAAAALETESLWTRHSRWEKGRHEKSEGTCVQPQQKGSSYQWGRAGAPPDSARSTACPLPEAWYSGCLLETRSYSPWWGM